MLLISAEPVLPKASARTGGRPGLVNENPDHVRPAYCQRASRREDAPVSGWSREIQNAKRRRKTVWLPSSERGPRCGICTGAHEDTLREALPIFDRKLHGFARASCRAPPGIHAPYL